MKRLAAAVIVVSLTSTMALAIAAPARAASLAETWADFNGDGYSDLVVTARTQDVPWSVSVIPGSADGLVPGSAKQWTRSSAGAGAATQSDRWGNAVAAGDFNGDGFSDLAIGAPGAAVTRAGVTKPYAGIVVVLHGSASGLVAAGIQTWSQESPGIHGLAGRSDAFGESLAVGDFDGNGFDDLSVGSPGNAHRGGDGILYRRSGQINVIYGSVGGLTSTGTERYLQASTGIPGATAHYDHFGSVLAAGDAEGDGYDELAIGTPEDGSYDFGSVTLLRGSAGGLTTSGASLITQNTEGVPGVGETSDRFGASLAFGDLNNDSYEDLAVGIPHEYYSNRLYDSGEVLVIPGSGSGLVPATSNAWTQESEGVPGAPEPWDQFGYALAAADFDGDGVDDLMIGVPGESIGDLGNYAGASVLLWGAQDDGLSAADSVFLRQGRSGIADDADPGDAFGESLAAGDFDGDGIASIAVGSPGELVNDIDRAGAFHVLDGSLDGLTPSSFYEAGAAATPLRSYGSVASALAG